MKTLKQFILELQAIKKSLHDKPITIQAPNGIYFDPEIKFDTDMPLFIDKKHVKKLVITFE